MGIKNCIKITSNLNDADIDAVLEGYDAYSDSMDDKDAATLAIDDALVALQDERVELLDEIYSAFPELNPVKPEPKAKEQPEKESPVSTVKQPTRPKPLIERKAIKPKAVIRSGKNVTDIYGAEQPYDFVQNSPVTKSPSKTHIDMGQLKKITGLIKKELPGVADLQFHLFDTQSEAFGKGSVKEHGRIKGGFYAGSNEMVLIAENIKNFGDAVTVIRHELVGHFGLRTLLNKGGQFDKILERVYEAREGELKKEYDWVAKYYPDLIADENTRVIADEMMARAAETKTKAGILDKIYDMIVKLFNQIGLAPDTISRKEMESLIRLSENNLRKRVNARNEGQGGAATDDDPLYMVAWHGGPHDFEQFDTGKIGTGEGAQAYGWGIYFADNREVAAWYKERYSNRNKITALKNDLKEYAVALRDRKNAGAYDMLFGQMTITSLKEDLKKLKQGSSDGDKKLLGIMVRKLSAVKLQEGQLYQVELAPKEDEYLLWDKPLSEQSEKVQSQLKESDSKLLRPDITGAEEYRRIVANVGSGKEASNILHSLGIRGIKYLDGSSRGKGEGSYNYVIFSDKDVEITEKFYRREDDEFDNAENSPTGGSLGMPLFRREDNDKNKEITGKGERSSSKIKTWFKRNLTKEGLMNQTAFEIKLSSDAIKNVGEEELSFIVHNFEKAIRKSFGVRYNKLGVKQAETLDKYLRGDDVTGVPRVVAESIDVMREYLDMMSGKMIESLTDVLRLKVEALNEEQRADYRLALATNGEQGNIPEHIAGNLSLAQTIQGNIGSYVTRSYQAFDDESWKEKALMNKPMILEAEKFIKENNEGLTPDEVSGAVRAILQKAKDNGNFVSMISNGTKIGSKDVSIVTKRKIVPPIIKKLLGEYKDPRLNFARSVSKMQWYIANHHFLMNLREKGMNSFIFDKPTGEFDAQIATEGSKTMNPLDGLYTTEDFRLGMEDALNKWDGSDLMRQLIRINSMVKYGKTILSPTTQMRNFESASMFSILNGHFNWLHAAKAFKVAKADLFTKDEKWKEYINGLVKIGVMHDNPYAGELRDAINDITELNVYKEGVFQKSKQFLNWMQKAYQIGDDFWKVIGFENEVNSLLKSGMPADEARKKAAYRIRNGYPTYSMVPRGIQKLRRWPLIGTFVSFPYEIIRTSYNQFGFIKEDYKEGRKVMASKRVIGMAIASSAAYAASKLSMTLMGMDADDDEAVRDQMPEWSRNSQLYYIGYDEDGLPIYFDLSYIDPYTYLKKPITALFNNNNIGLDKKALDVMTEIATPFIGTDIAAGTIIEIWTNKKSSGGQVYSPEDSGESIAMDIINHARKGIQPGIMSNAERTLKAITGETSRSGREYKVADEMLAWIGFRVGTLNLAQSMVYKAYGFTDEKRGATRVLSKTVGSQSDVNEEDLEEAFNSMMSSRSKAYDRMIKYVEGARTLGMEDTDIRKLLGSAGITRKDVTNIMKGEMTKWRVGGDFMKAMRNRAIITSPSEDRKEKISIDMDERKQIIRGLANDYN